MSNHLRDPAVDVRAAAARALGRLAASAHSAEPALIEAVDDGDAAVRQSAYRALRLIRAAAVGQ